MTKILIDNKNNFSLLTLKRLLNSLEIDVLEIEDYGVDEVPQLHQESIQRGLADLKNGKVFPSKTVSEEAKNLCLK